ncbi:MULTISPECIES: TA system antitoxin ParD family protein [unclassified Rhodococcus (in: high G+C Gram-positive bacteria)]|uniref:TA system antitoxin ParD family protein n=1 Tax=unclassified Rhodococcus (in: high G+C Gram-positive bacteria) TaxID=192944 RepID=UPI0011EDCB1F|nr:MULTISPECIES: hypothetical protein [unclassified Rhodococcus (in: high G+C Gram-positive bacteria)]KAA0922655.1 hypothetical protein FQ188_20935 [Rhodococcus sp. ANT_H53B]MDI6628414.1 hypothetical protein [Rhodococcus sp. (in: high G+C Gram-positive bacteria)]MDV8058084.1 hypothetical protein [Rhodococcus sp. IEGM 1343]MDV8079074.1 hypothetical protein [Rhodococcus sp. IEGM 1370]
MGTTSSLRIDDELYDAAKVAGSAASRSAAQQIAHWALIGREMELSHRVSARDIADVLAGKALYDDLTPHRQAVVRAEWTEQIESVTESLDFESEFTAEGRSYVESDEDGNVEWSNHR